MGLYVNPTDTTKEQWLLENIGTLLETDPTHWLQDYAAHMKAGLVSVVLVNNGPFNALAVAFDRGEAEAFARADGRNKVFCTVPRAALADPNSGVGEGLLRAYKL